MKKQPPHMRVTQGLPYQELERESLAYKNGCEMKIRYMNKQDAKRAIRRTAGRKRKGLQPYRCRFCAAWHIGHAFVNVY